MIIIAHGIAVKTKWNNIMCPAPCLAQSQEPINMIRYQQPTKRERFFLYSPKTGGYVLFYPRKMLFWCLSPPRIQLSSGGEWGVGWGDGHGPWKERIWKPSHCHLGPWEAAQGSLDVALNPTQSLTVVSSWACSLPSLTLRQISVHCPECNTHHGLLLLECWLLNKKLWKTEQEI